MLAPGQPSRSIQPVGVRDVARFALTGPAGVFNLTGPGSTMQEFLGLCRDVVGGGPNALLAPGTPPSDAPRELLRREGPVRIVARAEPHKGIAELIAACPSDFTRDVEIVLATARFEYWPGMQREAVATCRRLAERQPRVRLLPALAQREVQPFLAGSACTTNTSTAPETFCNTALEALSVGTPVITFDLGHVPILAGEAGTIADTADGAHGLWQAATAGML